MKLSKLRLDTNFWNQRELPKDNFYKSTIGTHYSFTNTSFTIDTEFCTFLWDSPMITVDLNISMFQS